MTGPVSNNSDKSRYELEIGGEIVFANYRRDGSTLIIRHVEAPPILRGTGAAGRLMKGIAEIARAEGARILPLCGYAAAWLRRHKEHRDLLA